MDELIELFSHYKGDLKVEPGHLTFTHANTLIDHGRPRKVECKIRVGMGFIADPGRYNVIAEEKTLEIIGGSSSGQLTKEEALSIVKRSLERYNFERKEREQTSLF